MKNLSLKHLGLESTNLLGREQLKTVFGGYNPACTVLCNDGARIKVDDCSTQHANSACSGHNGPQSCAGGTECVAA